MKYLPFLIGALAALALPACALKDDGGDDGGSDSPSSLDALAISATSLTFSTQSGIPGNPPPDVHVTVTDAAKVQALFLATLALESWPSGVDSCPADFGVTYELIFDSGGTKTLVTVDPNGCSSAEISDAWATQTDEAYFALLAETLGVPEAKIYPYHPPGYK